ncbi:hypothetical protein M1D48_17825 [Erwinia sp. D4-22]
MPGYNDLQCKVEICASSEPALRELLGEIEVAALMAHNESYALPRRRGIFNALRQRLFRLPLPVDGARQR